MMDLARRVMVAGLVSIVALVASPAMAGAGANAGATALTGANAGTHDGGSRPVPVVYDSDLDFDDASTLAYLCEEHKLGRIDLRAVTIANNGFGVPGRALAHAHSVLRQCGLPRVPVADGSTGAGVHPAPPELVATIETVLTGALGDAQEAPQPPPFTAADLLAWTARSSPRAITVLATGPLTNVAVALAMPGVAARIGRIQVMGGALAVPGNLYGSALPGFDNTQEFNFWMDPVSAQRVLDRARPGTVHLVPLDATRFVPITQDFVARLAADQHAPGARITYAIVSQPDLAALIALDIMYWWDALAAVSLVRPGITTFVGSRITVVQSGVQSGRTVVTAQGQPVRAALDADGQRFEDTFLDVLNGRD